MADLRCIYATASGDRRGKQCSGHIRPLRESPAEDRFVCSADDSHTYDSAVVDSYRESPLWHRTSAIANLLEKVLHAKADAYDSTFPWIDVTLNERFLARISTTTASWSVDFHEDGFPNHSASTDFFADSEDTEAIAGAVAANIMDFKLTRGIH